MDKSEEILKAIAGQKEFIESEFKTVGENAAALGAEVKGATETLTAMDTRVKDLETRLSAPSKGISLPGVNEEKDQFSFMKAIYAIKNNDWSQAGFEAEVFKNTREKALSSGTGSEGGYTVPTEYVAEIIELLQAKSVVMGMGATVLNNLSGSPVEFPKLTGGATAYWVGENVGITESQQTLGQLTMSPKQVAALTKMSNRLLRMADPSVEAMVRRDLAKAIALAIDLAALRGSGSENQPLGIANTPGINNVEIDTQGGRFLWEHAQQMEGTLEDADALDGKLGYIWNAKIKRLLKSERYHTFTSQTADQPYQVGLPGISDAKLKEILGYDFASSTQIPTNLAKGGGSSVLSEAYFGNWQELLIGQWGGLELMASNEAGASFETNQTFIRIIQDVDMGLRHAESFCLVNDADITGA